ncbi:MAG TPA: UBP-type zinc finger domain-containing protein [Gemmatimonadota bacterium]|nr:UBP-type zinc finger domain-containing protein [Gemmatimonadota bacterium]
MSAGVAACTHLDQVRDVAPRTEGCEECLRTGSRWMHLRMCRTCGHVGCCDSSPNRHATSHFRETGHPIVRSAEPGEAWSWCFVDEAVLA